MDPNKQLKTDPRTESIMWIGVSCPIVYAVAKQGFNMSTGSSALLSAAWGGALWSMQSGMVVGAWQRLMSGTQTKPSGVPFVAHFDPLNQ